MGIRPPTADGRRLLSLVICGLFFAPTAADLMLNPEIPAWIRALSAIALAWTIREIWRDSREFWTMPASDSCLTTAIPSTVVAVLFSMNALVVAAYLTGDSHVTTGHLAGGLIGLAIGISFVGLAARDWTRMAARRRIAT